MTKLEYTNPDCRVSLEIPDYLDEEFITFDNVVNNLVWPVLLAAGYSQKHIDNYLRD